MEGRPLDEVNLIGRARAGDTGAYGDLVRAHQDLALRIAYLIVRDSMEAEDVVQDAFVKAHRHLDRFRPDAPFRPWLLQVVRNTARNRVRSRTRREHLALRVAAEAVSGDAAPSPETAALATEARTALLAAVEALPDRYRMAVACRFLLDLSETETATVLGVPRGTVKSRTARGLARLRAALGENEGGERHG